MTKIKNSLIALLFLILSLGFLPILSDNTSKAYDGENYVMQYVASNNDGSINYGFQIYLDVLDKASDKEALQADLKVLCQSLVQAEKVTIEGKRGGENAEHLLDNIKYCLLSNDNGNLCGYEIIFDSFQAFSFYYDFVNKKVDENLFITKINQTFIAQIAQTQVENLENMVVEILNDSSIKDQLPEMKKYFSYISLNSRLRTNATEVGEDQNGKSHYIWDIGEEFTADYLKIRLTYSNAGWWYLLGIAVPLVIMILAIAIVLILKHTKRKEK